MIYDINKQQLIKRYLCEWVIAVPEEEAVLSSSGLRISLHLRTRLPGHTRLSTVHPHPEGSSHFHTHTHKAINTLQVRTFDLSMWVKAEINSGAFTITFYSSLHNFQLTSEFELQNTV